MKFGVMVLLGISILLWIGGALDVRADSGAIVSGNGVGGGSESVGAPGGAQSSFGTNEVVFYDYAKCIESCDKQYEACAKGGDAGRIKYCSDQHDKCRKACLEHK